MRAQAKGGMIPKMSFGPPGIALALSIASTLVVGSARAQVPPASPAARDFDEAGVIVLSGPGASDGLASAVRGLATRRGLALVDRRPVHPGPSPVPNLVARAVEAYQGFRYPEAIQLADSALSALAAGEIFGVSPEAIADVLIYRGLARSALGDRQGMWDSFGAAATILPARVLDPVRFPPSAVQTFESARAEVAKLERAKVILTAPSECKLNIDGNDTIGPRQLVHGRHYAGVECAGRRRGLVLDVSGPIEEAIPLPQTVDIDLAGAQAIAADRGADLLLWIDVPARTPVTATVTAVNLKRGVSKRRVVAAKGADIAVAVRQVLERKRVPIVRPIVRGRTKWYWNPWLWGAAGVAVATAIILPLTLDRGDANGFSVSTARGME